MAKKELNVVCPCCESRLVVDMLTERVVTHARKSETDATGRPLLTEADWDAASSRVAGRLTSAEDRMSDALSRERTRGQDLDALFEQIKRKGESPTEGE